MLANELRYCSQDGHGLFELPIAARKRAGMTQQQVAESLGRPKSFVAKYEGGERRVDVVEFLQAAGVLGADLS